MIPYYQFVKDENLKKTLTCVRFDDGTQAAILDQYCENPECPCVSAHLLFDEIDDKGKRVRSLFSFLVDTQTWKISDIEVYGGKNTKNSEIREMAASMGADLKEMFIKRVKEAKEFGLMRAIEQLGAEPTEHSVKKVAVLKSVKIGRNDPCSCGSGKKFKKCCGLL